MSSGQEDDVRVRALKDAAAAQPENEALWSQLVTLSRALGHTQQEAEALMVLAMLHHDAGRLERQEAALRRLVILKPERLDGHIALVGCLAQRGKLKEDDPAFAEATHAVERHLDLEASLALLEHLLLGVKGRITAKLELVDHLARCRGSEHAIGWLLRAIEHALGASAVDDAVGLLEHLAQMAPHTLLHGHRAIELWQKIGHHDRAQLQVVRHLEAYPEDPYALELAAASCVAEGDVDAAIIVIQSLLSHPEVRDDPAATERLSLKRDLLRSDERGMPAFDESVRHNGSSEAGGAVSVIDDDGSEKASHDGIAQKPTTLPWSAVPVPSTEEVGAEVLTGQDFASPPSEYPAVLEAPVIAAQLEAPESDLDMLFAFTAEVASEAAGGCEGLVSLEPEDVLLLDD